MAANKKDAVTLSKFTKAADAREETESRGMREVVEDGHYENLKRRRDQSLYDKNPLGRFKCGNCANIRPFRTVFLLCDHLRNHENAKIKVNVDVSKYKDFGVSRCKACNMITADANHGKKCKGTYSSEGSETPPQDDEVMETKFTFSEGKANPVTKILEDALPSFREIAATLTWETISGMEDFSTERTKTAQAALFHLPMLTFNSKGKPLPASALSRLLSDFKTVPSDKLAQTVLNLIEDTHARDGIKKPRPPPIMEPEGPYPDLVTSGISKMTNKVVKLAAANRCSKALATLQQAADGDESLVSDDMATSAEVRAELCGLHPAAHPNRDALPPRIPSSALCTSLSLEELLQGISDLPSLSAAAMSPWTFELIKQVTLGPNPDMAQAILRMFNLILEGKGGDPSLWTLSRLVALRKPNGKIRPIAVGDVWLRLLGKIVAKKFSKDMGETLSPHNLGVGVPGGAEIAVHAASLFARLLRERKTGNFSLDDDDDPWCLIALDFKNAFNTLGRKAIYEAIKRHCPELLGFFHWSYGGQASLRLGEGSKICESSTGVRQGDPLGPLFFCIGIHDALAEVAKEFPEAHSIFYLDDGTMMGRKSVITRALFALKEKLSARGLDLEMTKTIGWDPLLEGDEVTPDGLQWTNKGVTILGGPVGGALSGSLGQEGTFASEFAGKELKKMAGALDLLRHLPKPTAFVLLSSCINARPTYLARTISPDQFSPAAQRFDSRVDESCA